MLLVEIDFRTARAVQLIDEDEDKDKKDFTSVRARLNARPLNPDLAGREMIHLLWELRSIYGSEVDKKKLKEHVRILAAHGNSKTDAFYADVRALRETVKELCGEQTQFGRE